MGKNPRIWQNPKIFNPDRFESEVSRKMTQYFFTPFLAGNHHCPGQHFALIEAKTVVILLMQQFNFRLADNQENIDMATTMTSQPDKPLRIILTRRDMTVVHSNKMEEEKRMTCSKLLE